MRAEAHTRRRRLEHVHGVQTGRSGFGLFRLREVYHRGARALSARRAVQLAHVAVEDSPPRPRRPERLQSGGGRILHPGVAGSNPGGGDGAGVRVTRGSRRGSHQLHLQGPVILGDVRGNLEVSRDCESESGRLARTVGDDAAVEGVVLF